MRDVSVGKNYQAGDNSTGFTVKMCFTGITRDNPTPPTIISGRFDKKRAIFVANKMIKVLNML